MQFYENYASKKI